MSIYAALGWTCGFIATVCMLGAIWTGVAELAYSALVFMGAGFIFTLRECG